MFDLVVGSSVLLSCAQKARNGTSDPLEISLPHSSVFMKVISFSMPDVRFRT